MLDTLDKLKIKKEGEVTPEELEEEKAKYNCFRHGVGIQLFGKNSEGVTCKYAGEWCKDKVHGDGHYIYPDGSMFKGNFNNGIFEGYGIYQWPLSQSNGLKKRHQYKGIWVSGKMHGKGEFTHADGSCLQGTFANNQFEKCVNKKTYFLNPFLTTNEQANFIKKSD